MKYPQALEALMRGSRIARSGWNGKNMFVYLNKGSIPINGEHDMNNSSSVNNVDAELFEIGDKGTTIRMPNINMQAADGSTVVGWLASQTDQLANDWDIL